MKNNFENYTLDEISEYLSKIEKEILSKEVESKLIEKNLRQLLEDKKSLVDDIKNKFDIEPDYLNEYIEEQKKELIELLQTIQIDVDKMNG